MTIHSSLYRAASVPLTTDGIPDPQHYPVGTLGDGSVVLHAQPGIAPIAPLTVYHDGSSVWTWGQIATAFPTLTGFVAPHRWDLEATDADVVPASWPKLPVVASIISKVGLALLLCVSLASCNGLTWDAPNAPLPHDSCYWSYTYARGSTTVKTDSVYGCLHFVHGQW